ncbi:MAG: hypothetical protein R3F50_19000 [Gammaproteobacteria bacterium]
MSNQSNSKPGEGNREADKVYRDHTREFVKSGKVEKAAREASKQSPSEAAAAEQKGKVKARELDPAVHRNYEKAVDSEAVGSESKK